MGLGKCWALPAGVWLLGGVSLLNHVAREAIDPLLPFFLARNRLRHVQRVADGGALVSSVVFGLIWTAAGATTAFLTGACPALIAAGLVFVLVPAPSDNSEYETYPGHQ